MKKSSKQGIKNEFGSTNSREIWKNELLCAQFLRGYTKVSLLENVQPEDIEDITEALRPFVGVEYEGDTVKQIQLHGMAEQEVFVVGLLEHKSNVDYDVTFQLLKYMVGIWALYRNRKDKEKKGSSKNKDFQYPLIIPIVYYEGQERWTADMHWKDRVEFSEAFGKYVPDFTYEVVDLQRYSNEELLSREEELSLVMMLNRVQKEADLHFAGWSGEQRRIVEEILRGAPEEVLRILAQMIYHFGLKMNLQDKELIKYVKSVEDRNMGELWANMDKIDIPEIRRKAKEDAEAEVKARVEAEVKARVEAEVKARVEAEVKAKVEAEVKEKAEKMKEEADQEISLARRELAQLKNELAQKDNEIAALYEKLGSSRIQSAGRTNGS